MNEIHKITTITLVSCHIVEEPIYLPYLFPLISYYHASLVQAFIEHLLRLVQDKFFSRTLSK